MLGRELRPEQREFLYLRVFTDTGDAVHVGLANTTEVILALHLFGVAGDGGDRPRVLEPLAEILNGVATERLEEVLPPGNTRSFQNGLEPLVLVAVAGLVYLAHRNHQNVPCRVCRLRGLQDLEQFGVEGNEALLVGLGDTRGEGQQTAVPVDHPPLGGERFSLSERTEPLQ